MSDQQPDPNDSPSPGDADFTPSGNRPAQGARQATPGSVFSQSSVEAAGAGDAMDFLGLDAEMSGAPPQASPAPEPTPQPAPPVAPAPQPVAAPVEPPAPEAPVDEKDPSWLMNLDEPAGDGLQVLSDEEADEAAAERAVDDETEADELEVEDGVSASWVEDATPTSAARRYGPRIAAAVVVGMLGMTGFYVLQSAGEAQVVEPTPLAPELNTTPGYQETLLKGGGNQSLGREAVGKNGRPVQGGASDGAPAVAGTQANTETAVDDTVATAAVTPIWERTGQTPPPDAGADPGAEPTASAPDAGEALVAETTLEPEPDLEPAHETLAVADPLAANEIADETSDEVADAEPADESASATTDEVAVETTDEVAAATTDEVAVATNDDVADETAAEPEPAPETAGAAVAALDPVAADEVPLTSESSETAEPQRLVVGAEVTAPAPSGGYGPALPAGTVVQPVNPAPLGQASSRVSRKVVADGDALANSGDGPRKATIQEMKGVWLETSVPLEAITLTDKLLTPRVGRVRVVLDKNEIFEGRLYSVGQGQVVLDTKHGRMGVDGTRVQQVLHIDTPEGGPELGGAGAAALAGLENVRVKTPGGVFYGKVIARDEKHTTLVTENGARVTLDSTLVEFLSEVPTVALRRPGQADDEVEEEELPDVDGPRAKTPDEEPAPEKPDEKPAEEPAEKPAGEQAAADTKPAEKP